MKCLKMALALVLALAIAFVLPLQSMAAGGKYVSEVYVAYGKDAAAAKKTLEDKGFTPVEGNLNDGGDTYVMMGYKTTDNIRDSVTDLAVMNMDGNYSTTAYADVLNSRKEQVAEMLTDFMAVIREYRANLRDNKPKATLVREILNKFIDDDTGMHLGDLFNSVTLQDRLGVVGSINRVNPDKLPDLLTIFMQGNSYIIYMIESVLAIAADTADNTWIDRFAASDYDDLLDRVEAARPDLNTEAKRVQYIENTYGALALSLASYAAELRAQLIEYETFGLDISTATEEDIKNTFGDAEATEDDEEKALISSNILTWTEIGVTYENLKNYEGGSFAKGELLEFFMEDDDDTERYFPMAAAFSDGQRGGMDFVDLKTMIRYAFLDAAQLETEFLSNDIFKDYEERSVYSEINRELFKQDGSVAYTAGAVRQSNTDQSSSQEFDKEKFGIFVLWAGTIMTGAVGWFGSMARKGEMADLAQRSAKGMCSPNIDAQFLGDLVRICKYACILFALAATGYTIYKLSQTEEIKLSPIPRYFVDTRTDSDSNAYEVRYQAADCNREEYFGADHKEQSGPSADLCADEGKQWLVLYVSKNSMAGKPLTPDFKYDVKPNAPANMDGSIHLLGESGAVNLAYDQYRNFSSLYSAYVSVQNIFTDRCKAYVFFKLSNDVKTYDEAAGNMTATTMSTGKVAIFGIGGLAIGAVLGAVVTALVKKKKSTAE